MSLSYRERSVVDRLFGYIAQLRLEAREDPRPSLSVDNKQLGNSQRPQLPENPINTATEYKPANIG